MPKTETREKLTALAKENPFIDSVSVTDIKASSGDFYSEVRIHTHKGTSVNDIKDAVSAIFPLARYEKPQKISCGDRAFWHSRVEECDCEVTIFSTEKEDSAKDGAPQEITQVNYTESEVQTQ